MRKRGQIFLVAAVLLALVIFSLVSIYNDYQEKIVLEDFPDLSSNYQQELKQLTNEVLLSGQESQVGDELESFTNDYVDYARTIDPNIGFVYVYWDRKTGTAKVVNYGDQPINVIGTQDTGTAFTDQSLGIVDISLGSGDMKFKKTVPVRLTQFDETYNDVEIPEDTFNLEVGGVFYNIGDLNSKNLQIISKSSSADGETVIENF